MLMVWRMMVAVSAWLAMADLLEAKMLGQSRAEYGDLASCIAQARLTAGGFKSLAPSIGISDVRVIELDHSPRAFQTQTFYTEKGIRLVSFFVCSERGSATLTHSTLE
jgi:hypothetical protein